MSVNRFYKNPSSPDKELELIASKGQRTFVGTKAAVQAAMEKGDIGNASLVYITDDYAENRIPAIISNTCENVKGDKVAFLDSTGAVGIAKNARTADNSILLNNKKESALNVNSALIANNLNENAKIGKLEISSTKTNNKIVGRDLVKLLGATSARDAFDKIRAMGTDYSMLQIGDYIDIPIITAGSETFQNVSNNLRVEIQGFDHYNNVGDNTVTGRGILWGFRNCITKKKMNSGHTNTNGYNGCELRTWLNDTFAKGLEAAIGPIKTVRRLAEKHASASWWTNWVSEKVFLPTEVEVWGHQIWGNAGYSTGTSIQYPIYALDPSRRMKTFNGSRMWWWEGTSCVKGDDEQPNSSNFCRVNGNGGADNGGAAYDDGVSPAFYI